MIGKSNGQMMGRGKNILVLTPNEWTQEGASVAPTFRKVTEKGTDQVTITQPTSSNNYGVKMFQTYSGSGQNQVRVYLDFPESVKSRKIRIFAYGTGSGTTNTGGSRIGYHDNNDVVHEIRLFNDSLHISPTRAIFDVEPNFKDVYVFFDIWDPSNQTVYLYSIEII